MRILTQCVNINVIVEIQLMKIDDQIAFCLLIGEENSQNDTKWREGLFFYIIGRLTWTRMFPPSTLVRTHPEK